MACSLEVDGAGVLEVGSASAAVLIKSLTPRVEDRFDVLGRSNVFVANPRLSPADIAVPQFGAEITLLHILVFLLLLPFQRH